MENLLFLGVPILKHIRVVKERICTCSQNYSLEEKSVFWKSFFIEGSKQEETKLVPFCKSGEKKKQQIKVTNRKHDVNVEIMHS